MRPPDSIGATLAERNGEGVVSDVMPEGPAAQAGLQPGDVLLAVDGHPVRGGAGAQQSLRGAPGPQVTVRVRRDGAEHTLTITRASRP